MRFRKLMGVFLVIAVIGSYLTGCTTRGGSEGSEKSQGIIKDISIGTAAAAGLSYHVGTAIANLLNDSISGVNVAAEETAGGSQNIHLIVNKEVEMAITTSAMIFAAGKGLDPFKGPQAIQMAWKMFDGPVGFYTLADSGITLIEDLRGKKIGMGAVGSGVAVQSLNILEAHGLEIEKDYKPVYMGLGEMPDALADNVIDAAISTGVPSPQIQSVAVRKDVRILSFDTEKLNSMTKQPGLPFVIKAGTYPWLKEEVVVQGAPMYMIVSPDLSEELVYQITKLVIENKEKLGKINVVAEVQEPVTLNELKKHAIQLHPGAERYFREVGMLK